MKSKKEFGFLVSLLMAILFAQNASAIPVGGVLYDSYTATFDTGSGYAIVDSDVYEYASGEYVYTCQIFNQNSTIGFSFFSVGILDGATAWSPSINSDPIQGWVDPVFWTVVGSPVQSVDYLFANTIDTGQRSALLWFVSDSYLFLAVACYLARWRVLVFPQRGIYLRRFPNQQQLPCSG